MIAVEHNMARRAGLTMVELLVSVVVLLVVMLSFGTIMRQIQRVVSTGEKTIRTNSAAAAIVGAMRTDIGRITRNGMLCITQVNEAPPPTDGYHPLLTFTAAGVVESKIDSASANASLVAMGLCAETPPASWPVLYCQRWVLTGLMPGGFGFNNDGLTWDLANIQSLPRSDGTRFAIDHNVDSVNDLVDAVLSLSPVNGGPFPIALPCHTPTQAGNLWQVLADRCEWVSVTWTDGPPLDANGLLRWYGVDYTGGYSVTAKDGNWTTNNAANVEFNVGLGPNIYRALWTHHNQNNWPRALRIRYRLIEDANAIPPEGKVYEVICPVGG